MTSTPPSHSGSDDDADVGTPRRTVQREAVLMALREASAFVSAQALFETMQSGPAPVALATVYRHLNAFDEAGLADSIWRSGHQLYKACDLSARHHHLVCTACGRDADMESPLEWLTDAARARGYTVDHVVVEITGRCTDCSD